MEIIKKISKDLNVEIKQVEIALNLLKEGNTVPFIARYRKEKTNNLNEEQIRLINEVYEYQVNLLEKKETVIRLIEEKGLLTLSLKNEIMNATKLIEVDDLYRPYKEKRKTKATEAIKLGLEPLANKILKFPLNGSLDELTTPYLTDKVKDVNYALTNAGFIIAEIISDNPKYRKWIRSYIYKEGSIKSKLKKDALDTFKTYEMYYNYVEKINSIKPHRILALNRGEKEKILTVRIEVLEDNIIAFLEKNIIKNNESFVASFVKEVIKDSYKRLIFPSIEREIRSILKERAEIHSIKAFSLNLEKLLLQPTLKEKTVLGFDPAYRTGCKLAVLNPFGEVLKIEVIYPHLPQNQYEQSKKTLIDLINEYNIEIIAIGNGTASRESELLVAEVLKEIKNCEYIIVNEAGASVYSASSLAIEEFPNLEVQERSAISIGRRIQDPLSELVKIDPKSIGVGMYQHDLTQKLLSNSLNNVLEDVVNLVGVNINIASPSLLQYVSGIKKNDIKKIIKYRNKVGKIKDRQELTKILSPKTYEQSIGFLRIIDGINPLDKTDIHPESYGVVKKLLNSFNLNELDLGSSKLNNVLSNLNFHDYLNKLKTDKYTLKDIINSLQKPTRDPRDMFPQPILKKDILKIEHLKKGMKLQGTVRNVVDFGAFVDIGLENDGLIHISKLSNSYIPHPSDIVNVGDIIECYVEDIDNNKVSLSLIKG